MVEISVYVTSHDFAKGLAKIRERVDCSDIDIPIASFYRTFKYLYPHCLIDLIIC